MIKDILTLEEWWNLNNIGRDMSNHNMSLHEACDNNNVNCVLLNDLVKKRKITHFIIIFQHIASVALTYHFMINYTDPFIIFVLLYHIFNMIYSFDAIITWDYRIMLKKIF